MTHTQTEKARLIIETAYNLSYRLNDIDVYAELQNLARKNEKGNLDDKQELLFVRLAKEGLI